MQKISTYILYGLMAVSAITFVMSFGGNHDPMLYLSYVLTIGALGLWVVASILSTVTNTAKLKSSALSFGSMVVVFGVSYALASDTIMPEYQNVSPMVSKLSDAGLIAMYILFVGAIGSILLSGVIKMIR